MEFCFGNIIYDNSLERPSEMGADTIQKQSYPGTEKLEEKLKDTYGDDFRSGKIYKVNGKSFVVRFRGYKKEEANSMSWGGVPEDSECKVFAILGTE